LLPLFFALATRQLKTSFFSFLKQTLGSGKWQLLLRLTQDDADTIVATQLKDSLRRQTSGYASTKE